jgi:RNA polymerase sigma-70 factor (ECF subfamily)
MTSSKFHFTEEEIVEEFEIIKQAKKDRAKFEILYNNYHEQIFRYIYQRVDNKELAFDITQQVFLKAMVNIDKYEFKGVPFGSWLYRIATNELLSAIKRNSSIRTVNIDSTGLKEMAEDTDENIWEAYQPQLIEAIGKLPEQDLQLVEMRFFQKMPFKQIAEILDTSEPNAKMRLYRILERMKKQITSKK